ncbi:MAG: hypothetical protein AABZ70_01670 [candidate division NC10 bacterium]
MERRGRGAPACYTLVMARRITVRKTTYREMDDRFDVEFWASISPDERFAEAWRLSEEIWRLKGWDPGEPGL